MKKSQQFLKGTFPYLGHPDYDGKPTNDTLETFDQLFSHFQDHHKNGFDLRRLGNLEPSLMLLAVEAIAIFYKEDLYREKEPDTEYINLTDTAKLLGISKQTLRKRMEKQSPPVPKPDHYVSGVPAWEKKSVEQFIWDKYFYDNDGEFTYPIREED
jgi:predicted DNA-binding transcriptional regulator AlpA